MGWNHIPFYSLPDERFSRDFGVEELFGINLFIRRGERIFRTSIEHDHCCWPRARITAAKRLEIQIHIVMMMLVTGKLWRRRARHFGHHGLRHDEEARHRGCALERRSHHLGRVDDAL